MDLKGPWIHMFENVNAPWGAANVRGPVFFCPLEMCEDMSVIIDL